MASTLVYTQFNGLVPFLQEYNIIAEWYNIHTLMSMRNLYNIIIIQISHSHDCVKGAHISLILPALQTDSSSAAPLALVSGREWAWQGQGWTGQGS